MRRVIFTKYAFAVFVFILISAFGKNSLISRCSTAQNINALEKKVKIYKSKISTHRHTLNELSDPKNTDKLEKFAREKYFMKNENEDVFIIIEN